MNKNKAKALVKLGFSVVPCKEDKTPYGTSWKQHPINTEALVDTYWYNGHDPLVGVIAGPSELAFLDLDIHGTKNGFDSIADVNVPETSIEYRTKSGGMHKVYRALKLEGNGKADITIDGRKRQGVDTRVGMSYAIWHGDIPTQEAVDALPTAPVWMYESGHPVEAKTVSVDATDWLKDLPTGKYSKRVADILNSVQYGDITHDVMRNTQYALLSEGAKGEIGIPDALVAFKAMYLKDEFDTLEYHREWNNALEGALSKIQIELNVESEDEKIKRMAEDIFIRNQANALAKRMEAAKYSIGTKRYSWDELDSMEINWVVEGVLAFNNHSMLVGDSNLGKTFLYIDWMCSSIAGLSWQGRSTQPAKFMVVIGEGATGYSQRIKAWCDENNQDYEYIKQFIVPMSASSLASDSDIDILRIVALEEGIDIIIFDTWSTNSGMVDENGNAEAALALNAAARINPDAGILIVHHPDIGTAKTSAPKARGASAVQGRMDFVTTLFEQRRMDEFKGVDKMYLSLSTESDNGGKSRHSERFRVDGLYLKDVNKTKVVASTTSDDIYNSADKFFKMALSDGPKTTQELCDNNKVTRQTVNNYFAKTDKVEKVKNGKEVQYKWKEDDLSWSSLYKKAGVE